MAMIAPPKRASSVSGIPGKRLMGVMLTGSGGSVKVEQNGAGVVVAGGVAAFAGFCSTSCTEARCRGVTRRFCFPSVMFDRT